MSVPNQVYPNTRAEDERLVRRGQGSFPLGLIKDIDSMDLPDGAVADLVNMRATPTGLAGRPGTFLWSPLKLPNVYDASTSIVTITRNADVVTADSSLFVPEYVNYLIRTSDNRIFFIIEYVDELNVKVSGADVTGTEVLTDSEIAAPINASYVDSMTGDSYYLIGTQLFGRKKGENEWLEYFVASQDALYSSVSSFHKVENSICLVNQSGIYWLSDIENIRYAIKMNVLTPQYKLNRREYDVSEDANIPDPSAYKYVYGYTLFEDIYNQSRYDGSAFIIRETPGKLQLGDDVEDITITPQYLPDMNNADTTLIFHDRPIDVPRYATLEITQEFYNPVDRFKNLYEGDENPLIKITFNSKDYIVFFNFSNIKTLSDVADAMQVAFKNTVSSNLNVHLYKNDRICFEIYSTDAEDVFSFSTEIVSEGWNLLYNYAVAGAALEFVDIKYNNSIIQYLRAPGSWVPITSYTIYRSADIYPHTLSPADLDDKRIGNEPNILALIDDTPVCKLALGNITQGFEGKILQATGFDDHDIGNTIYYKNSSDVWTQTKILRKIAADGQYLVSPDADTTTNKPIYYGAQTIREVNQTGGVITLVDGDAFDSSDVGRLIYWRDGTYDIVKEYDSINGTVTVFREIERTGEYCLMYPTNRVYNDTTSDYILIDGYLPYYPYNTRFFKPMPNTNVSSYISGYFLSAIRDKNELYYSQTSDLSRLGYHHSTGQINTSLEEGVKSITNAGGYFTVCTLNDTFLVNPEQANDIGDPDFGESYFSLPNPILTASGIGSTHQSKWANGMDAGLFAITNEPAVRQFDGVNYGPDLSEGAIKRKELQKMDSLMLIGYDHNSGVFIWGRGV